LAACAADKSQPSARPTLSPASAADDFEASCTELLALVKSPAVRSAPPAARAKALTFIETKFERHGDPRGIALANQVRQGQYQAVLDVCARTLPTAEP
jgi:hypothetical protein